MNETRVRKALALFVAALLVAGASGEALAKKKKKHKPAATQTDLCDLGGSVAAP
jgi:hypothetical protein